MHTQCDQIQFLIESYRQGRLDSFYVANISVPSSHLPLQTLRFLLIDYNRCTHGNKCVKKCSEECDFMHKGKFRATSCYIGCKTHQGGCKQDCDEPCSTMPCDKPCPVKTKLCTRTSCRKVSPAEYLGQVSTIRLLSYKLLIVNSPFSLACR